MCPFPPSDGHDLPWLIDELVPGLAAQGDDLVIGYEDPVRQPVVAHELPYVFDRIEFWRSRRQGQERDVGRDHKLVRGMPSGPVDDEEGMGARRHLG